MVVLKHTEKRTRQTVHIDRLLPCHTPPPAVPEADSGVPTDIPTETDELDTPDVDSQPLMGMEEDSQSWGTLNLRHNPLQVLCDLFESDGVQWLGAVYPRID